jgi:hypothetical protein
VPPLTTHLLKLNPVIACSDWESVSSVHRRLREFRAASDTRLRHHLPVGWCCWARESYRDRADHFGFRCSVQMLPATSVDCSETGLAPFPRRSMKPAEPQPRVLNASSFSLLILSTPRQRWCSTRVPMFLQWNIGLNALGFAPGACWPSWAGMTAPKFRPAVASRRRFRMGCSQVLGRLGGGTRLSTLAGRSAPRFSPTTVAFAIAPHAVQDRCLRPKPSPSDQRRAFRSH